jgi:hypothetical protein
LMTPALAARASVVDWKLKIFCQRTQVSNSIANN